MCLRVCGVFHEEQCVNWAEATFTWRFHNKTDFFSFDFSKKLCVHTHLCENDASSHGSMVTTENHCKEQSRPLGNNVWWKVSD